MGIIKPKKLCKGDLIGIVAPASFANQEEKIINSVKYLESIGYNVTLGEHIRTTYGYLAGSDKERANDFNKMILDKNVKAIFCLRGGYGTTRILDKINYDALKNNPKIIVGYSDITALQLAIFRKIKLVTFSGPMPAVDMYEEFDQYSEENFWSMLTSKKSVISLKNPKDEKLYILRDGDAKGILLGGNLSMVTSIIGTPYQPNFKKSILVLEDVDETPHRIDRMLSHLYNSKILNNISGLVFGKFTDCVTIKPDTPTLTLNQIQEDYTLKIKCPVVSNLQYGHINPKLTIPLGIIASINKKTFKLLESAVE